MSHPIARCCRLGCIGQCLAERGFEQSRYGRGGVKTQRLGSNRPRGFDPHTADHPANFGQLVRGHAELTQAQAQEKHRVKRLATHRSADSHLDPVHSCSPTTMAIKRSTAGSAAEYSSATVSLVRSTARVYWIRSLVPIEKKSTSFAS